MDELHSLLKRQLKRNFGAQFEVPGELRDFLNSVSAAYHEFDSDRGMLERSLEISSQELIQSNAETRSIIQLFPDAFLWLDQEGNIINNKSSGQNALDWLQGILSASHIKNMQPENVGKVLVQAFNQAVATNMFASVKFSIGNGSQTKYYEARVIPPVSNRILVLIRDFTEQKLAELRLEESEDRFRRLVENAPDIIARFELNPSPHYAFMSPAIMELTGFTPEEFYTDYTIGYKMVHPEDRKTFSFTFNILEFKPNSIVRWRCKNGSYIWIEQRVVPVLDKARCLVAIESISRDISERIIADKKIQELYEHEKQQRQELEEEAKARGQFIDVLAHELRTPLTPVLVSVEMLNDLFATSDDLRYTKLIASAFKGTTSLVARLEELLDLAKFSRGTFKLFMQPVNPGELLENTANSFRLAIEKNNQHLQFNIPTVLPTILADPSRLEQVLLNLLSNASKYSPQNTTITLAARHENNELLVEIKDQGIGISRQDQDNLFKPYHRVEQDRQRFPGIGLGLAVSKQIIEAHHGRIWIESQPNAGSVFKFVLPIEVNLNADFEGYKTL
jgi:PAS domain S-box-containing protein